MTSGKRVASISTKKPTSVLGKRSTSILRTKKNVEHKPKKKVKPEPEEEAEICPQEKLNLKLKKGVDMGPGKRLLKRPWFLECGSLFALKFWARKEAQRDFRPIKSQLQGSEKTASQQTFGLRGAQLQLSENTEL